MAKSVFTDRYKLLTAELLQARTLAGLTQTEVAQRLKKPQSFIAKVEGGERRIDVIEFLDLTAAIGVDPHQLLDRVRGKRR